MDYKIKTTEQKDMPSLIQSYSHSTFTAPPNEEPCCI